MKLIIDIPEDDYIAVRCEALYYIGHDRLARSVTNAFQMATPYEERPQGEWKLDNIGVYCSECKKHPDCSSDFCPFCGADMRSEK